MGAVNFFMICDNVKACLHVCVYVCVYTSGSMWTHSVLRSLDGVNST